MGDLRTTRREYNNAGISIVIEQEPDGIWIARTGAAGPMPPLGIKGTSEEICAKALVEAMRQHYKRITTAIVCITSHYGLK